jgi:hypothetical protein
MYINDICNVSNNLKFVLFADDTNAFCSGKDITELSLIMNNELNKLDVWFSINKLSLNIGKTNFMIFGNKKNDNNARVVVKEKSIERVTVTTFLGVYIEHRRKFKLEASY